MPLSLESRCGYDSSCRPGFREIVVDRDPLDNIALQSDLLAAANFVGAGGPTLSAIGAIDLAVWDLKGHILKCPVHTLLGSTKTHIPAYASGGSFQKDVDALSRELHGYLDQGFKAIKIKLPPDVKQACRRIIDARLSVGMK